MRLAHLDRAAHRALLASYADVDLTSPVGGATCDLTLRAVPGYHLRRWSVEIPGGDAERLGAAVMRMAVHRRAGLWVDAAEEPVVEGTTVVQSVGGLGWRLLVPVRVTRVVAEPGLRGFAYGTLPGHPEEGEEAFLVEPDERGCRFTVVAAARPAALAMRLSGPLGGVVQTLVVRRYLAAARALAS